MAGNSEAIAARNIIRVYMIMPASRLPARIQRFPCDATHLLAEREMNARVFLTLAAIALYGGRPAVAGDDASGPIQYSVDLSQPFTMYAMSEKDQQWSRSLVRHLKHTGPVLHFVRTSLPLRVDGSEIVGAVYRAVENLGSSMS